MKKSLIIAMILCFVLSMTAFGQGVKGKMFVSGHTGYTLGFGDPFYNENDDSFKPGINFDGIFHYGVSDKIMLGGEVGFQKYVQKDTYADITVSESTTNINFLFNGLYALKYEENVQSMFVTFGAGLYGLGWGEVTTNKFGLFSGIVYQKMITPEVGFVFMPRFHFVFAEDEKVKMLSLSIGVNYPLGKK